MTGYNNGGHLVDACYHYCMNAPQIKFAVWFVVVLVREKIYDVNCIKIIHTDSRYCYLVSKPALNVAEVQCQMTLLCQKKSQLVITMQS